MSETTPCPGCGATRMTAEVEAGVPCDNDCGYVYTPPSEPPAPEPTSMFDNTYTDQEGVVWDWKYAVCPRCRKRAKPSHYHFTTMTSFLCPHCEVLYDEPHWEPAEVAFVTCISDEESRDDPDPEVRRRHREYHGLPPEE